MIVSLHIQIFFTNVPSDEAIELTVNLLNQEISFARDFNRSTSGTLMQMVAKDVVLFTLFRQVDGVAMGSPVGPLQANILSF